MQTTQQKTVVITGCSSGIGLACCKAALAAGHHVIATARSQTDLAMLTTLGAKAVALELSDEISISKACEAIRQYSGGAIDVLFNNAGFGLQVAMEDANWHSLNLQLNTNVTGPVILTNALLPCLGNGSQLIFNSSILGLVTLPFRGPYCMSKYAIEAAADAYRLELEPLGIRVQIIQPGPIEANFRKNALTAIKVCLDNKTTRLDYQEHLMRLQEPGPTVGSLPSEACADVFMQMIDGRKKAPRYLITATAKWAAFLKRLLGSHFHNLAKSKPSVKES